MKFSYELSAALVGTSIVLMQSSPRAVALSPVEVGNIAKEITVRIDSKNPGSGVIIAKEANVYFVLTAGHVVNLAKNKYTIVTPDGGRYPLDYRKVKKLPGVDLAIVQFSSSKGYTLAKLGNSDDATEGTEAYVAGWSLPSAAIPSPVYRFTEGRITAKVPTPLDGYDLVYSNNTISGMSGGVVLNNKGELIGVHGRTETTIDPVSNVSSIKTGFSLGISLNPYNKLITQNTRISIRLSAQAAELEALFAGFENGCDMNSRFFTFHGSLVRATGKNPDSKDYYISGNPRLPKGIEGLLGRLRLEVNTEEHYTLAHLPLKGRFYGLPVIEYQGLYGNGSGWSSVAFTINAPISRVREVLRRQRIHITQTSGLARSEPYKAEIIAKGRRTLILCDWSD